jgi:hypothetical protein
LHFALETAQRVFQRLTFLNADFSHLDFTVLPMHVAMIAINHKDYKRPTRFYKTLLALTSSGPAHRSQALFFSVRGPVSESPVWDFFQYLLECPGTYPCLGPREQVKEMLQCP